MFADTPLFWLTKYFRDPFTAKQDSQDGPQERGGPQTLSGIYDFTERLLFEKLWQDLDFSEEAAATNNGIESNSDTSGGSSEEDA